MFGCLAGWRMDGDEPCVGLSFRLELETLYAWWRRGRGRDWGRTRSNHVAHVSVIHCHCSPG
jgi:hypothetical protein